jgi:beta-glucanase (GH16 family)
MLDGFVANAYPIPWNKWTPQNQTQGLVNNEQEAYVTDGSTISDDGGTLTITAYSNNNGYGWKSGKLLAPPLGTSRGYIEASMNTPSAQGTWPAFWLMPNENNPVWPQGGEIDIMEQINGQAVQNVSTHFGPNPSQVTSTHITMNLPNMSGQYHRYGMAWDTSHCAFYVDGVQVPGSVRWFPQNSPFAQYLPNYTPILNLAIGGDWPGYAADGIGNQVLKVRYVAQSTQTPSDF